MGCSFCEKYGPCDAAMLLRAQHTNIYKISFCVSARYDRLHACICVTDDDPSRESVAEPFSAIIPSPTTPT
jgi:hypothetical protein